MTEPTVIGIDPGVKGAICFMASPRDFLMAEVTDHILIRELYPKIPAYLEQVHASPVMGVKGAFTFGMEYGRFIHTVPKVKLVRPQEWQRPYKLKGKQDYGARKSSLHSLACALSGRPNLRRYQADAYLIALYGWYDLRGEELKIL